MVQGPLFQNGTALQFSTSHVMFVRGCSEGVLLFPVDAMNEYKLYDKGMSPSSQRTMNAVNAHVYIADRLLNALLWRFDTVYLHSFDGLVNKYDCCLRALCTCKEYIAHL